MYKNSNAQEYTKAFMVMKTPLLLVSIVLVTTILYGCKNKTDNAEKLAKENRFITPLGKVYSLNEPSGTMLKLSRESKTNYEADSESIDNIIWYGRRTAYLGRYDDAIEIYSKGISLYPDEPRLLRHRGHRYISQRKYELAIVDFEKAGQLIEGTENEIEPDGLPNARNIPVSTLHGNIWYHLGLAYYLKHDYQKAFDAYIKCRDSGDLPDNLVSATHWLYMIQRRLGNEALAKEMLDPVEPDFDIIENTDYYNLCRFYKGLALLDSLNVSEEDSPSSDALKYGIANWYFYNGDKEKAKTAFEEIVSGYSWTSFGYIAAESDLLEYFPR